MGTGWEVIMDNILIDYVHFISVQSLLYVCKNVKRDKNKLPYNIPKMI